MYPLYFILVMLAPAAMLLVGWIWRLSPPPYQKKGLSYDTELTRRDPKAWNMAHRHCARLWIRIGVLSGLLSAGAMIVFSESFEIFWMWLIAGQMVLFCLSVLFVDLLLKVRDLDGHKK